MALLMVSAMCFVRKYLLLLLLLLNGKVTAQTPKDYDVVVYGGTPAGIIAAISAAREGASVVVIEPTRWVGGMVTGGLTKSDIGNPATIGGYPKEFFTRAATAYPAKYMWYAEPQANMAAFQAMLREAKVEVITSQRLNKVEQAGKRIRAITLQDGRKFVGKMFIDATYEGDLMARAGVSYIVGRESREQYGESLAGYMPIPLRPRTDEVMASTCACVGGTGPHYIHGTPSQISARDAQGKLIFGVTEGKGEPGAADNLTQSYNFRVVVTKRKDILVPFPKPQHYDASRYELLLRLIKAYPQVRFARLFHLGEVANGKFDLNAQGLFSTDYPGGNVGYPDGDYATRDRIWQDHVDYIQGMLWFLGHDDRVPKALRDEANEWGLCRDEFVDNHYWPYALYVREARRMIGEYVMVQADCQGSNKKTDSVGMGSFVIDCHIVQRIVTPDGFVTDEGSFPDAPARPYQIPYRSLTPKRTECENLLVPVCLSASHIAYCSLRMEPVYMALGQASGVAASMAIKHLQPVQAIDVTALQGKLREQKAVLELHLPNVIEASSLPGIVMDDEAATYTGDWTASSFGTPIEGASRHDQNNGKGTKTAQFAVNVPKAGKYEVRFAYASASNRASNVPIIIEHADGQTKVTVNEKLAPQFDKAFTSLGTFRFGPDKPAVITISTEGTDSFVSVDAVQLLLSE